MGKPIIEIQGLTKDYASGFWRKRWKRSLDNLTLEVEEGEVFGFLGPNGAGKTTTLKLLMGLIFPTSGTAIFPSIRISTITSLPASCLITTRASPVSARANATRASSVS
jgi:ABC-type multidrug transport system ATPase subunit